MSIFNLLQTGAAGMSAQRRRAEVTTANLANAETTRTPEGGPYRRRQVVFEAGRFPRMMSAVAGVQPPAVTIREVVADPTPPELRYEPGHPDADAKGYVAYPAINPVAEMADLMGAVRAYQMNASAVQAGKQMIQQAIDILR
ncbi:MAG TPA: flagellar basal body rod protein FlgC [Clostridia bacterium]|nr:flagellar basal body rod protein FlgC [Clostridia bacterium]